MRTPVFLRCSARLSAAFLPSRIIPPCLLAALHSRTFGDTRKGNSDTIRERARSTAEEFSRQAKEKVESVAETAKEAWEGAQETAADKSQEAKDKFKEQVEKGNYDKIGQD